MRENLACLTQSNSSLYSAHGQPPLNPGGWPGYLTFNQLRRQYGASYKHAAGRYPDELEGMADPAAYNTGGSEAEAEESDDEIEWLPLPLAKKQPKRPSICVVLPRDQLGNVISRGRQLFKQGKDIDSTLARMLDALPAIQEEAEAEALAEAEADSSIQPPFNPENRLYLWKEQFKFSVGKRRRLLGILITQQERIEDCLRRGIDPPSNSLNRFPDVSEVREAQEPLSLDDQQETEDQPDEEMAQDPFEPVPEPERAQPPQFLGATPKIRGTTPTNVGATPKIRSSSLPERSFTSSFEVDFNQNNRVDEKLEDDDLRFVIRGEQKEIAWKSWQESGFKEKMQEKARIRKIAEVKRKLAVLMGTSSEPEKSKDASSSSGTEFRSYPTTSAPETEPEPEEFSSNLSEPDQCTPYCADEECDKKHERIP